MKTTCPKRFTPLCPKLGHGLSYTAFKYRDLQLYAREQRIRSGEFVDISLTVENVGGIGWGKDQCSSTPTIRPLACTPRPVKELKGYRRLKLEPGETGRVAFHLPAGPAGFLRPEFKADP